MLFNSRIKHKSYATDKEVGAADIHGRLIQHTFTDGHQMILEASNSTDQAAVASPKWLQAKAGAGSHRLRTTGG